MPRSDAVVLILTALLVGYPFSYSALRATQVLTHVAFFTSAEGLDAHHVHLMDGNESLQTLYKPLIAIELELQRRHKP